MRICDIKYHVISISLIILFSSLIDFAYGQEEVNETSKTQTYENQDVGIRMSYPSNWGNVVELDQGCHEQSACVFGLSASSEYTFVAFAKYSKETCNCNSLKDLLRITYEEAKKDNSFSFINDNQTTVGKKYPAWQYEYSFTSHYGMPAKGHDVVTTNNETYLVIGISYPIASEAKISPQFKKLIDSIEFLPIQNTVTKTPSFMNMNKTGQTKTNSALESSATGLQILSHNSFTDSLGYMHVVGEIRNNSPSPAIFVKITGTFYDANDQVVGTDFAYADPYDLGSGQKAPFELLLTEASVPLSQIDHYNLIASSQ